MTSASLFLLIPCLFLLGASKPIPSENRILSATEDMNFHYQGSNKYNFRETPQKQRELGHSKYINCKRPQQDLLKKSLPIIEREINRYSKDFIQAVGFDEIVVCGQLTFQSQQRYVVPSFGLRKFFVQTFDPQKDPGYLEHAIHHDLFHAIDRLLLGREQMYKDQEWRSLNTPGHSYGYGGEHYLEKGHSPKTPQGFVSNYSLSAVEEDKAEIYATFILQPHKLSDLLTSDPILASKTKLLLQRLKKNPATRHIGNPRI